jgi:AcrR family transcriptional regulator
VVETLVLPEVSSPTDVPNRPPGRPRSAQSHQAILDATLELLAESGFQGASVEAIAARARVGKTTIYRRWRSKEQLVADALAQLRPHYQMPDTGDLQRDLHAFIERAVVLDETMTRQILAPILGSGERYPELLDICWTNCMAPRRAAISERLTHAKERGEIRADVDADLVMDLVIGAVLYRLLFKAPPEPFSIYIRRAFETLWYGIASRPARQRH